MCPCENAQSSLTMAPVHSSCFAIGGPPVLRILRPLTISALFITTVPAWAGFIRGQVRYDTGQVADHVIIRLRSDMIAYQTETQTDIQGKFELDGLPLSPFHLT